MFRQKGDERRHHLHHRQNDAKERLQASQAVRPAGFALETLPVGADVPIGQDVDKLDESGNDGVETIGGHFRRDKLDEGLSEGENPFVHVIVRGNDSRLVVSESHAVFFRQTVDVLHEEPEGVVPWKENVF